MDLANTPVAAIRTLQSRAECGRQLLEAAAQALSTSRAEAVDLHLIGGHVVRNVLDLHVDLAVVHVATRPQAWTHSLALDQVAFVEHVARGGRRSF